MRQPGNRTPGSWSRFSAEEGGGVAIEFAIISVALVFLSLGTIEFGRALAVKNQLSFVADKAAREILKDGTVAGADVEAIVREEFDDANPELLQVEIEPKDADGFRTVSLSYPFMFLIPQLSSGSILLSTSERVPVT